MALRTSLTQRLGLAHPLIQAPMAGGATTPELVSAVSEAGALGFIGAAYLQPDEILALSRAVRARTSRPFGINLFAPVPATEPPEDVGPALARLASYHAELGLPEPALPLSSSFDFEAQLGAALESGASAFSFTFGLLASSATAAIRGRGMYLIGTATTVDEALQLEAAGVDAVVAQGSEAGAHRGTFAADFDAALVGTMALVPQIADAVRIPVIASGGIMDGRGMAAALLLGADAAQLGTAFLTCHEAGIPEAYKSAILEAREDHTRVTRVFSGRPARGLVNRFMTEVEADGREVILPYPLQNALTRPLRAAAARQERREFLSLWAGQGVRLARRQSATELVNRLAMDADAAIARLTHSRASELRT
jgi:nitronate monooxygenase